MLQQRDVAAWHEILEPIDWSQGQRAVVQSDLVGFGECWKTDYLEIFLTALGRPSDHELMEEESVINLWSLRVFLVAFCGSFAKRSIHFLHVKLQFS